MYRKVTCTCKVVILGGPCRGRYWDPKERLNGRKKTGRRVLLPVLYFSVCHFPRPLKLSLALGPFTGSHEDVCQWTVVFILSVLNWGYIISRESVLNRPYTEFVRVWRYCMHDWVDLLLDFFCPKQGQGFKPSRSPGRPRVHLNPNIGRITPFGDQLCRVFVRSLKLDCIISVKEITRKH